TNLVTNGGFEGSLSPWSVSGIADSSVLHHTGSFSAATNTLNTTDTLSQAITTVAGHQYLVDYWVASNSTTGPSTASATLNSTPAPCTASGRWNGTTIAPASNIRWPLLVDQTALVPATGPSSPLAFSLRDSSSGKAVFLDDVSVTPVPAGVGTPVSSLVGNG